MIDAPPSSIMGGILDVLPLYIEFDSEDIFNLESSSD